MEDQKTPPSGQANGADNQTKATQPNANANANAYANNNANSEIQNAPNSTCIKSESESQVRGSSSEDEEDEEESGAQMPKVIAAEDLSSGAYTLRLAEERSGSLMERERAPEDMASWKKHKKHILIFSSAGKPIYSRYGNESELSAMFGLLQAISSKLENGLKSVRAGKRQFVFVVRGPIYLVAIAETEEPMEYLERQLEYLHAYILFHFTSSALEDTFRRKPGYDLRDLWGGTESELKGLITMAHYSPGLLLDAVCVLPLPEGVRHSATETLHGVHQTNLIYAVLLAESSVVTTISPKKYPLISADLLLIINFVQNSRQLRSQETWTPLCLPAFNSTGFLHAYAAYISKHVCLILLSSGESLEQFHYSSKQKIRIQQELIESGVIGRVEAEFLKERMSPSLCDAAACIHLVYKCVKTQHYFETGVSSHAPLYLGRSSRKRMLRRYAQARDKLAPVAREGEDQSREGTFWEKSIADAVLAIATPTFELYATFHPFATSAQAHASCER